MPPGIGDELLDLLRYIGRGEFVVIATPSSVVVRVVDRLLELLRSLRVPLLGLVENMRPDVRPSAAAPAMDELVAGLAERYQVPLLASVPYVPGIEDRLSAEQAPDGALGRALRRLGDRLTG
jgi:ATP-binding protein involved in chromosome partitioning